MTKSHLLFFTLVVALSAAPVASQGRSVAGCYALTTGAWSGPFPSGWPEAHQPPDTVHLHVTRARASSEPDGPFLLSPNIPVLQQFEERMQFGDVPTWRPIEPVDSLLLLWHNGFAGVRIHATVEAEVFSGTAYAFHDVIGPNIIQPTAPVRGHRVSCPGE
jgi:hypothetical protein